jgi:hypothetical protein
MSNVAAISLQQHPSQYLPSLVNMSEHDTTNHSHLSGVKPDTASNALLL